MEQIQVAEPAVEDPDNTKIDSLHAKQLKREKERDALLENINAGNFRTLMSRVAGILNMYPDTRNSDVRLALEYWELFQNELFNEYGILPRNLFKLERMTNLTRARAKIQNDYGLFQAKEGIKRARKKNEETMLEAVIETSAPAPSIHIYADETGKTADWLIVGAVWVLDPRSVYLVTRAIDAWKEQSLWAKREIHFTKFGNRDIETLNDYLDVVVNNRDYLGFKFAAVERSGLQRSIEEAVIKLHELMIIDGLDHEIQTQRVSLPRNLHITLDHENSLDKFALRAAKDRVNSVLAENYSQQATIEDLSAIPSRISTLVQLSDVISGAVNRKLNNTGERAHKDEMADLVLTKLGITLGTPITQGFDASTVFLI